MERLEDGLDHLEGTLRPWTICLKRLIVLVEPVEAIVRSDRPIVSLIRNGDVTAVRSPSTRSCSVCSGPETETGRARASRAGAVHRGAGVPLRSRGTCSSARQRSGQVGPDPLAWRGSDASSAMFKSAFWFRRISVRRFSGLRSLPHRRHECGACVHDDRKKSQRPDRAAARNQ